MAEAVGADLEVMKRDAAKMRTDGPVLFTELKAGKGVEAIASHIVQAWEASGARGAKKM